MIDESYPRVQSDKWLRWIAYICLFVSAFGILVASYFFYNPRNFPFSGLMSPQAGQTLLYGGLVLAIAGFTWRWSGAGGIIAILYGVFEIFRFWRMVHYPITLIPAPLFTVLYGVFIIGGILGLLVGLRQKKAPYPETITDKRLRWAARIIAFATIIVFIIAYVFIYPPLVFLTIPVLFIIGIAWLWPAPGGFLMLLVGIPSFYPLHEVGWDFQWKWPIYILLLVFITSGVLHLVIAWRRRKRT